MDGGATIGRPVRRSSPRWFAWIELLAVLAIAATALYFSAWGDDGDVAKHWQPPGTMRAPRNASKL